MSVRYGSFGGPNSAFSPSQGKQAFLRTYSGPGLPQWLSR